MSTPTKPERVEARPGQRRRWTDEAAYDSPFTIQPDATPHRWRCAYDDGGVWIATTVELLDESVLIAPAPATPGTATVTPAPKCFVACPKCDWTCQWDSVGAAMAAAVRHDRANHASKPPASPTYGRLVGELRAPDGTPRTALEAIQAKREPEPWVESCDLLHWLRDA